MPSGPSETEFRNIISQMVTDMREPTASGLHGEMGVIEVEGIVSADNFRQYVIADESEMVAVDGGSSTLLDAGSFVVAGIRVGSARYSGRRYVPGNEPEMHMLHLSVHELANAYSIFFSKTVGTEPPDSPRGLEEAVGRIRTLMEWKYLEETLDAGLEPGTVLAFDGALWAGIKGIGRMLERIVSKASEREVTLCGISKKSMLTHKSRPLIPSVQMAGESALPGEAWHYPVEVDGQGGKLHGKVHVAKLHPHSRYAFRVDLALPNGITAGEAMGKLSYHANDPTYAGYPYPLARVHNDVAFSRSQVEDLRNMLRSRAIQAGMDPAEWQMTFQNFHDVLDVNR
jgi:hypothetical protein